MGRIRTSRRKEDPTPKHIFTDHDWVRNHQDGLLNQYGPCFLMVYHEQVLGTGKTEKEAVEAAERNLPEDIETIELMPEWIGRRNSLFLLRRMPD
jgi:hypothetical protein